jgi:hypothetical protein
VKGKIMTAKKNKKAATASTGLETERFVLVDGDYVVEPNEFEGLDTDHHALTLNEAKKLIEAVADDTEENITGMILYKLVKVPFEVSKAKTVAKIG